MLKIINLNVDDKILCIKTLELSQLIPRTTNYYKRRQYLQNKKYKELTKEEKLEKKNFDFRIEEIHEEFIKNKTYTIIHKSEHDPITSITLYGEKNEIMINNNTSDNNFFRNEIFLNEYFTTSQEQRKQKMETLSDNTFSDFLNKLKK